MKVNGCETSGGSVEVSSGSLSSKASLVTGRLSVEVKAVATNFEVVRPGSGCGLFNMDVVCSTWVWSVKCRCGFVCLILC